MRLSILMIFVILFSGCANKEPIIEDKKPIVEKPTITYSEKKSLELKEYLKNSFAVLQDEEKVKKDTNTKPKPVEHLYSPFMQKLLEARTVQ
jgi:hypothetical protein